MTTHLLSTLRPSAALILAMVCLAPANGADSVRVGTYDFGYASGGDMRARPVQVFDDGRNTYFQFRPGEAIPAIFSQSGGLPQLLVPRQEGPYVRVENVHGRFLLQVGRSQAMVVHAGGTREDAPALAVVTPAGLSTPYAGAIPQGGRLVASLAPVPGALDVAPERNSYATPQKGDAVRWVQEEPQRDEVSVWFQRGSSVLSAEAKRLIAAAARRAGANTRFAVVGRDDDSLKEGLDKARAQVLSQALEHAGVSRSAIAVREGAAAAHNGRNWASTIQVETERPLEQPSQGGERFATIRANLRALVQAGVLRPDQADALLAQRTGAAASATRVAAAAGGPPAPTAASTPAGFMLRVSDKTIQGALRRWAQEVNHQLVWDAPPELDAKVLEDFAIGGATLQDALQNLLAGLKDRGYSLDAVLYSNRVVRVSASGAKKPADAAATPTSNPAQMRPASAPATPSWQMRQADRTVAQMLTRWAADANWKVVWNATQHVAIAGDAAIGASDFPDAAAKVMAQVSAAGYRLRATPARDNTLLVSSY